MATKDPRIDAYIKNAEAFARPVLIHLRKLIHKACPDVEETIKWGFPHFDYNKSMMCHLASFKQHCAFGFWKASLIKNFETATSASNQRIWNFDKITSLNDLPDDSVLIAILKEAAQLNADGIKLPPKKTVKLKQEIPVPDYLLAALQKNKKAKATFEAFSYSNRKEYIVWLEDAKTEATRLKRLTDAVEWMAEGKIRNWKYLKP